MNNEVNNTVGMEQTAAEKVKTPEVSEIPEIAQMPQINDMPSVEDVQIAAEDKQAEAAPAAAEVQAVVPVQTEPAQIVPAQPSGAANSVQADNSIVICSGVRRRFGNVNALDGVNLVLPAGKIIGLLGPNGAGKTTLIKILNGLLQADEGVVSIGGFTPGVESKKIVSYLPDRMYFADWMKVGDMIDLFSDFYEDFDKDKAAEMCRVLGLERKMRIKSLSKGTREKMQLMLVMSRKAKLYLLDEPIAGVDPAAREFILHTILTNYNQGGTVMLSTHLISDVEEVLDEAVFINAGRIILHDSVDNIRQRENKSVDALFRDMFRADYSFMGGVR